VVAAVFHGKDETDSFTLIVKSKLSISMCV